MDFVVSRFFYWRHLPSTPVHHVKSRLYCKGPRLRSKVSYSIEELTFSILYFLQSATFPIVCLCWKTLLILMNPIKWFLLEEKQRRQSAQPQKMKEQVSAFLTCMIDCDCMRRVQFVKNEFFPWTVVSHSPHLALADGAVGVSPVDKSYQGTMKYQFTWKYFFIHLSTSKKVNIF